MLKKSIKESIINYAVCAVGGALFGFAFAVFIEPQELNPGGLTGVGAIINYFTGIPVGTITLILNLPLLYFGYRRFGMGFIKGTVICTIFSTSSTDTFLSIGLRYSGDRITSAAFGGLLMGIALGMVMLRGATTGGTDIAALLAKIRFPFISTGRLVLLFDAIIIAASSLVYRNIESALYSAITVFVFTRVMDTLMSGAKRAKVVFIVTDKAELIIEKITKEVKRGITVIDGKGGYSSKDKKVLLCAVRPGQVIKITNILKNNAPSSFLIVSDAGEVFGEGFSK